MRIFEGFFHIIHIIHNQNSGKIGLKVSAANHNEEYFFLKKGML